MTSDCLLSPRMITSVSSQSDRFSGIIPPFVSA
uniref:Uncharacterized protein n=1 Tax=Siphoviridae sp. ctyU16 TaxID=2827976 RepID=A0A8S5TNU3_9CAUD|nr:MAG TPA: hypothetical protein [Siphoviridae sp. ctyU16]